MADISLITGNLTVLGSTTLSGSAYLPSGYTNNAFVPSSPITRYLLSNGTESTIPFGGGGAFATGFKFGWGFSTPADLNRHINTQRWYIITGSSVPGRIQGNNTIQINKTGVIIPFPNPAPASFFSQGILTSYTIDERFNHIEQSGVFALQSAQKIGFGTFDPQEKVHVSGGNLRVDNTGFFNNIYLNGQILNSDTVSLTGNQTISGIKAFVSRPIVNGTGVLLSGEVAQADLSTTVRTTGNQNISGLKTFAAVPQYVGGIPFLLQGQAVDLVNYQTISAVKNFLYRPTVNGIEVLLSGDLNTTVRTTGNQNISGVKTFASGIVAPNLVYNTGNQTISGVKNFFSRVQVNGTGVLLSGEGIPSPIEIFNNGSSQGNASSLNFAGAGISVNTAGAQATITVTSSTQTTTIPTSSNSAGVSGSFAISDDYFYFCKRPNKWVRTALSEW